MLAQHARRHNAHENLSDPALGRPLCLLGLTLLKLLLLVLPVFVGLLNSSLMSSSFAAWNAECFSCLTCFWYPLIYWNECENCISKNWKTRRLVKKCCKCSIRAFFFNLAFKIRSAQLSFKTFLYHQGSLQLCLFWFFFLSEGWKSSAIYELQQLRL